MPKKTPYEREMQKRYPPTVFNSPEEAENYKTLAGEKGIKYDVAEHKGQFYVDEPHSTHPYWHPVRGERKPKIQWEE